MEHLKELFLHYRFERIDDLNDFAQQIMLNASLKSTPVNVKINCYEYVRCFLDLGRRCSKHLFCC